MELKRSFVLTVADIIEVHCLSCGANFTDLPPVEDSRCPVCESFNVERVG